MYVKCDVFSENCLFQCFYVCVALSVYCDLCLYVIVHVCSVFTFHVVSFNYCQKYVQSPFSKFNSSISMSNHLACCMFVLSCLFCVYLSHS